MRTWVVPDSFVVLSKVTRELAFCISCQLESKLIVQNLAFRMWIITLHKRKNARLTSTLHPQSLCSFILFFGVCLILWHCLSAVNMMTSSNGNIFRVTSPLCGEFTGPGEVPTQRPVTRSFDVFFDLCLNKRLNKQPWGWWFETLSWSLWRHCDEKGIYVWLKMNTVSVWCSGTPGFFVSFGPDILITGYSEKRKTWMILWEL